MARTDHKTLTYSKLHDYKPDNIVKKMPGQYRVI